MWEGVGDRRWMDGGRKEGREEEGSEEEEKSIMGGLKQ